jgi:membrane protease YdiL (CAAX protease family)
MGAHGPRSARPARARAGLSAALVWLLVEAAIRWTGGALVLWWDAASERVTVGTRFWANVALVVPAVLVLAWLFARRVRRDGLTCAELNYRPWRVGLWPALGAGVATFGFVVAIEPWEESLFPHASSQRLWEEGLRRAGPLVGLVAVPANGIIGPVVEEFAWRGYIQSRMVLGLGTPAGVVVTALLAAAKHVVVDSSLDRVVTLIVGALVLGVVGARWGTQASTVAHVTLNTIGTLVVVVLVPLFPSLFS